MKRTLIAILIAGFPLSAQCGDFTPEEQGLLDRHMIMEVFAPTQHSGHCVRAPKGIPVLIFVFGREDAEPARKEGAALAVAGYKPDVAVQQLLVTARGKYPSDPFFVKCWMDVAANAYNSLVK